MRKFVITSLLAAVLAATTVTTACNKGDPNALETHVVRLDDAEERADAIKQLERIVGGIDQEDPRRAEFAEKVLPKFAEIYDADDVAPYRDSILDMAFKMKRPEAASIWTKAITLDVSSGIDGSAEGYKRATMAIAGIREAKATEATAACVTAFTSLQAKPGKDMVSGNEGMLRSELAKTLGALQAKAAVEPLIAALQANETEQPKRVYKAAIDALGQIGDPAAVDALITVQFSVADSPGPQSIGERAIRALGAIGEGAVPKLTETLQGKNEKVNALAAEKGVEVQLVQQLAVKILGVVGSTTPVSEMLAYMPQRDCGGDVAIDPETLLDYDANTGAVLRAFAANALGFIGDPAAVEGLCKCRNATHNPTDLWEITSALGRIGGEAAYQCTKQIVTDGFYDTEEAVEEAFKYEIRWQGARYMILAAPPSKAAELRTVIDGNDAKVKAEVEKLGWTAGITVLETCKEDIACYEKTMDDSTKVWFEREVAAFNFARMSKPGDAVAAAKLAKAFKTRDPEARMNIAWLSAKVAGTTPCPACADELEKVMKAEDLTKDGSMQPAWITARQTIAKVTHGAASQD